MAEEHVGFANTLNDKGDFVDAREVEGFNDESEAGQTRAASQTTPSSIVDFKSEGTATNGAPAAVVPAPKDEKPDEADASTVDAAEGEEADDES